MRLTMDGRQLDFAEGMTILEAARANGIRIPTLCYLEKINAVSACRVCLVEVKGMRTLQSACATAAREGMEVITDSEAVRAARRRSLELICSDHRMECTECPRGLDCELRELCKEYGVDDAAYGAGDREPMLDESMPHLLRDNARCILCRRCLSTCAKVQGVNAIYANRRGEKSNIGFGLALKETDCTKCGQCVTACPTGALIPHDDTGRAWKTLLRRDRKKNVAFVSPYVCMQIGKLYGEEEKDNTGKVAAMLRRIGYDEIYLTGKSVGVCPAWRNYLEHRHPELAERLPEGDTPWERMAAAYKTAHPAEEADITAFAPCVAEKGERAYPVLSVRELGAMWKRACVSNFTAQQVWGTLSEESFDSFPVEDLETSPEAEGLAEAERLLQEGKLKTLHVLACPGGCACGGGSLARRENIG